jgi:hypothetical protein
MQTLLGTVHHLINAVNGLDPTMPPVQALIALNKIKSQVANSGQGGGGQQPTVAAKDVSGIMSMINGALTKHPPAMPESSPASAEAEPAADGGVAQLPSHFNFDGGGIVAFGAGTGPDGVQDPEMSYGEQMSKLGHAIASVPGAIGSGVAEAAKFIAGAPGHGISNLLFPENNPNYKPPVNPHVDPTLGRNPDELLMPGYGTNPPTLSQAQLAAMQGGPQARPQAPSAVPGATPGAPQGQRPSGIPMGQPPQAITSSPPPLGAGGQFLANQLNATEPVGSTYEERQKKYYDEHPELKKPAMSELEKHLEALEKNDQEAKKDREKREAMRNISDFFHNLSMAGRASAGQTGIGALLGNYGQVSHQSAMDALDRQDKYEQADRDHAINMVKYHSEIENARRAEARGDFTAAEAARAKAEEYALKLKENKVQAASALARDETSTQNEIRNRQSQETIARENRLAQIAIHNMPGAEQKMVDKYIADYMHRNPGATYSQGYDAFKQAPSSDKTDITALKAITDITSGATPEQRKMAQQRLTELAGLSGASGAPSVPQAAIDALKANPSLRQAFEQKYRVPASTYLGK